MVSSPEPMDVRGKTVIVTGAGADGSGRAISRRFASEGASVVVSDINESGGRETVCQIESAGGRAMFCPADVRVEEQVRDLIAFCRADLRRPGHDGEQRLRPRRSAR